MRLKRDQGQVAQEDDGDAGQHDAKRVRLGTSEVPTEDHLGVDAAPAPAASGLSREVILGRNRQVAQASIRHAEQMFVWHTQNVAAREDMSVLAGEGKVDTQQYRDLEAMTSAREGQVQACLVSGIFTNNELSHQLNTRFSTLME